ncbi:hypothetical protein [Limnohabitans lacus]|uniref:Uncharacterized protein n=1 Tax=Limnohabitans lacus TaxID=3045173 RepID=A0ABT6X2H5_9BURK|nr:hypothetical protein [Limnohabitans sp. HM2-2]MDI9232315.1 hypothetical protein [Limnohabitans sp. HM2-2]
MNNIKEHDLEDLNSKNPNTNLDDFKAIPVPYNHQKKQESARQIIAFALIFILFLIIAFAMIYLWCLPLSEKMPSYIKGLNEILQIVFTPLLTLTSTAVGYYFGSNSK